MLAPAQLEELVDRTRQGDAEAFTALVSAFERSIFALALQKVGHPEDAQDVAQEAFLEAFRTLDKLRTPAAFPGWLRKITLSHAYQRLRRREERPEFLAGAGTRSPLEEIAGGRDAFPDIDPHELPGIVLRAISRLPEAYQLPLMLRYMEKLTPQEMAQELEMNANTVRVTLHRGSTLLRKHFQDVLRERERP